MNNQSLIRYPTKFAILKWWKVSEYEKLPMCSCMNSTQAIEEIDDQYCNTLCPGDENSICGDVQNWRLTVYCSEIDGVCDVQDGPPITDEISTTEPTPDNPTTKDPTSTVQITTPTIPADNSTNSTEPNTTTTPSSDYCSIQCTGEENNGRKWKVCAGEIGRKDCFRPNSKGEAIWECLPNGKFSTDQPDYSQCSSSWLEDIQDSVANFTEVVSKSGFS